MKQTDPARSGLHIELDPEVAARLKARRNHRLHTVQIPLLRLIGFSFFALGVGLHNWLILGEVSWPSVIRFALVLLSYSLLSWLALRRLFGRTGRLHLGDLFLVTDVVFLVMAVYLSGGERSWIFFILLMRVADQAISGLRRALVFSHLGVLGYALMLAWIAFVDGRALPVDAVAAKTLFLYLAALYISLCGLPVVHRRRSISAAIHTSRDLIARLRVATEALEEARLHAEEANEAKSRFLATMSHEVRTPLNAVIGMTELLERTELDGQQRQYLTYLRQGADATLRLITDVLEIAALDHGRTHLEHSLFSPRALLHEVMSQFRATARTKGLELIVEVSPAVPESVLGDPRRHRQLLRLLLDNAVKFTPSGRVRAACEVVTRSSSPTPLLRWTVEDSGVGFDERELPRLMETFVQGDASTTRRHDGAGLGLALARRLTEVMGGTLDAQSAHGKGSTFWVEIPIPSDASPPSV